MAAVLGISRKEVLSRSFLRKTLSWEMTGKNVKTLNTKSCLNMIYNVLFIPTLSEQSSAVVGGTQRLSFQGAARISESRQYNPALAMQWSWKRRVLSLFPRFTFSLAFSFAQRRRCACCFIILRYRQQKIFAFSFRVGKSMAVYRKYAFDKIRSPFLVRLQRSHFKD